MKHGKGRLAIVTDAIGIDLATMALRFYSPATKGPAGLEVIIDRLTRATIARLAVHLEQLGFSVDLAQSSRSLAGFASKAPISNFPYEGAINLAAGIPAAFRVGQAAVLLEMIGAPYSGPDPQALLTMRDKQLCKLIAESVGVRVPDGLLVTDAPLSLFENLHPRLFPMIIKPNTGSSSVGLSKMISGRHDIDKDVVARLLKANPEGVLLEQFISGREITVLFVGNGPQAHVIPLILCDRRGNSLPNDFIYSTAYKGYYSSKLRRTAWFLARGHLTEVDHIELVRITRELARALRARDIARFDFRQSQNDGQFYFIECNGQPSLNRHPGSIIDAANRLWFGKQSQVEEEFLRGALVRMGLL